MPDTQAETLSGVVSSEISRSAVRAASLEARVADLEARLAKLDHQPSLDERELRRYPLYVERPFKLARQRFISKFWRCAPGSPHQHKTEDSARNCVQVTAERLAEARDEWEANDPDAAARARAHYEELESMRERYPLEEAQLSGNSG